MRRSDPLGEFLHQLEIQIRISTRYGRKEDSPTGSQDNADCVPSINSNREQDAMDSPISGPTNCGDDIVS